MELLLGEVAASGDGEDGKKNICRIIIERILLMIVVILQINAALERNSSVWLSKQIVTSTVMNVSSHLLIY